MNFSLITLTVHLDVVAEKCGFSLFLKLAITKLTNPTPAPAHQLRMRRNLAQN